MPTLGLQTTPVNNNNNNASWHGESFFKETNLLNEDSSGEKLGFALAKS